MHRPHRSIEEMTVADMQAAMTAGKLSSARLTQMYLRRIKSIDPRIKRVFIEAERREDHDAK